MMTRWSAMFELEQQNVRLAALVLPSVEQHLAEIEVGTVLGPFAEGQSPGPQSGRSLQPPLCLCDATSEENVAAEGYEAGRQGPPCGSYHQSAYHMCSRLLGSRNRTDFSSLTGSQIQIVAVFPLGVMSRALRYTKLLRGSVRGCNYG